MEAWPGQYCINVTDIERTIKFYEAIGLTNTSRTEIPQAHEAIMMDGGGKGGKIQLAQQTDNDGPIDSATRSGSSTSSPTTSRRSTGRRSTTGPR